MWSRLRSLLFRSVLVLTALVGAGALVGCHYDGDHRRRHSSRCDYDIAPRRYSCDGRRSDGWRHDSGWRHDGGGRYHRGR